MTKSTSQARRDSHFHFDSALLHDGWADNVMISEVDGVITAIETNVAASTIAADVDRVGDIAIPGMPNVHSHAFQRAFAGLSEYQTAEHDSFWTWRKLMYDSGLSLTPDDVYTIASGLYRELKSNGYTWVGEFQYLHNDHDGSPYADSARMSDRLVQAAIDVGMGICIMPVLYQRAGFSGGELDPMQKRFVMSDEAFVALLSKLQTTWGDHSNVQIGMAFHSLRAVSMETINRVVKEVRSASPDIPIHIHVAEQTKEVADCCDVHNARPVEYLLSEAPVDEHWCLIHATHINQHEIEGIAKCGAVVGLCPTTEANLGDGIFPSVEFLGVEGEFAIGSDSHVSTNPRSELRLLEYGQRLVRRQRAILGTNSQSVGCRLYLAAARSGAKAIGINAGEIAIGSRADLVVLDPNHPTISRATNDRILDRYIFSDSGNPAARTIIGGVSNP